MEPRIYIGPTFPRWGISFGQVFAGEFPAPVAEATARCRALSALIVPVSRTVSARADMAKKGTILHSRAAAAVAEYNKLPKE